MYHEVSQAAGTDDAIQSDFFSSSDRAEEFLKLRSRCLMSLLKEWAVGTSRITSKDYGATLSVASIDCMVDELAAVDVLPYVEARDARVGFWTDALVALDPEVQSVSQSSQSVSQSVSQ